MRMFMRNIKCMDAAYTEKGQRVDSSSLFYFQLMMMSVCVAMCSLLMFTGCGWVEDSI